MITDSWLFLALDLTGVFAFALNGALTAIRLARLDIVGVVTLGMVTALGGGIIRDVFIDSLPPATFVDWRYLAVAATGGFLAFLFGRHLDLLQRPILLLDTLGLSLFAVTGATKALDHGMGLGQAVILGTVTAVGGGTIRDVMIGQVPVVLRAELYAIPAMAAAVTVVAGREAGAPELPVAVGAATLCLVVRLLGVRFDLHAPGPPGMRRASTRGGMGTTARDHPIDRGADMNQSPQDASQPTDPQDQDSAPASEPSGAAVHDAPGEDQDAGPASEPGGASDTPES